MLQILIVFAILGLIFGAAFGGGGYLLARSAPMIGEAGNHGLGHQQWVK